MASCQAKSSLAEISADNDKPIMTSPANSPDIISAAPSADTRDAHADPSLIDSRYAAMRLLATLALVTHDRDFSAVQGLPVLM